MIYSHYFYSVPCLLYVWASSSICGVIVTMTRCFKTLVNLASVKSSSDTTTHSMPQRASTTPPLPAHVVSHQRNHKSFISHQQSISINFMNTPTINSSAQWHAWFSQRRAQLETRLEQATQAEWNWPSTRRRCEIHRLEDELRALDAEEFVVPSFGDDLKTSVAAFAS